MSEKERYRFWKDKDNSNEGEELEIRTCLECKFSEVKAPDGVWVSYLTLERITFLFENNFTTKCSLCSGV